jgi:hypothetical protein
MPDYTVRTWAETYRAANPQLTWANVSTSPVRTRNVYALGASLILSGLAVLLASSAVLYYFTF